MLCPLHILTPTGSVIELGSALWDRQLTVRDMAISFLLWRFIIFEYILFIIYIWKIFHRHCKVSFFFIYIFHFWSSWFSRTAVWWNGLSVGQLLCPQSVSHTHILYVCVLYVCMCCVYVCATAIILRRQINTKDTWHVDANHCNRFVCG